MHTQFFKDVSQKSTQHVYMKIIIAREGEKKFSMKTQKDE